MSKFDPYHKWLGISPKDQPPHHYRLLGIDLFETDPDVIDAAAERQMTFVHQVATGEHAAASQTLLNEIAAARLCLLDDKRRRQYEATLKSASGRKHWVLLAGAVIVVIVIGVGIAALLMTTAKDDHDVGPAIVVDQPDGPKPQPSRPTPDAESDQQPLTAEKQSESPESVAVESAPTETKAEEKKEEDNAVTEAPQTDEVASEQQTSPNETNPEVKPAPVKTASVPQLDAPPTAPTAEKVTKPAPPKTVQEIEYPQRTDPFSGGYPKELADVLQAISDDDYNRSLELLSELNIVAAQIKDHQLAGDVQELTRKCRQLQKSIKQVEAAKAALAINPHDPATNEELGKFYCIEKEDWDAGLRLLAKCGNEDLKRAAQLDLKPPANKTEEAALAHQWLDFANSERVRTAKQRFQLRGRYWFLKTRPLLPRDVQTALQERIDKIPLFADRVII